MPFKIQRVPQGLNNLLNIFGGATPIELEDRIRGSLELLQFYGIQQRRLIAANNAALAEGGQVDATTFGAQGSISLQWCVLFGATFGVIKTATMTACRCSVQMTRQGGNSIALYSEELGPFGATETGSASANFWAPYPILLVPPWNVFGFLNILGTDATANASLVVELGVLG